jgi:hypothetical protein
VTGGLFVDDMTAVQPDNSASPAESTSKNPYNTRRKSLYFNPTTHSATSQDPITTSTNASNTSKHPAQHPELNPRSPKRLKRQVGVDGEFTPPPSPPNHIPAQTSQQPLSTVTTTLVDISSVEYDEEDDPVINAIVHILQLSDNTPLSTRDLSSSILQSRLCPLDSPNPSSVVTSRITSHLKRRAAEKPPREPLLIRYESEQGRKRTEYYLKYPDLVSDRSILYKAIKTDIPEEKVLKTNSSKMNIIPINIVDSDSDEYDSEDISHRSPDRPTLFDPPTGLILSPDHNPIFGNLLSTSMIMDIDVPTGIKLDYEFYEPTIPIDNLTPPSEETSYPNTPLREVFSRRASPIEPDVANPVVPSPPAEDEPDDPQSPHSGAPDGPNTLPSFFDSPLIYHVSTHTQTEEVEMFDVDDSGDDDEVRIVQTPQQKSQTWSEDFTWEDKRDGIPSPEKVGMDELEEWLEGI